LKRARRVSTIMEIAKVIMDYYFHETVAPGAPADNNIMP
jgi:hypothetical protein